MISFGIWQSLPRSGLCGVLWSAGTFCGPNGEHALLISAFLEALRRFLRMCMWTKIRRNMDFRFCDLRDLAGDDLLAMYWLALWAQ